MRPVPERARTYLLANQNLTEQRQAQALSVSRRTITRYRAALIREGVLQRRPNPQDLEVVIEALADGATLNVLARERRVSQRTLWRRLRMAGLCAQDITHDQVYSGREVSRMLGYPVGGWSLAQIRAWNESGILRAHVTPGGHYRITAIALQEFLEHPDCPIDPTRITDPAWWAYAVAARAGHLKPPAPHEEKPRPTRVCVECGRPKSRKGVRCKGCVEAGAARKREGIAR